jgi:hypothetical protein
MNGNENGGTKRTWNGALDHVLVELDIARRDADGIKSNCALRERAGHSGPGRVPRGRVDDEGRTVSVMQRDLRRQGLAVWCRGERLSGRREYGGEGGAEMNSNKSELNQK